jgi:hypothetical protein
MAPAGPAKERDMDSMSIVANGTTQPATAIQGAAASVQASQAYAAATMLGTTKQHMSAANTLLNEVSPFLVSFVC